jgi:hypothetical protein
LNDPHVGISCKEVQPESVPNAALRRESIRFGRPLNRRR